MSAHTLKETVHFKPPFRIYGAGAPITCFATLRQLVNSLGRGTIVRRVLEPQNRTYIYDSATRCWFTADAVRHAIHQARVARFLGQSLGGVGQPTTPLVIEHIRQPERWIVEDDRRRIVPAELLLKVWDEAPRFRYRGLWSDARGQCEYAPGAKRFRDGPVPFIHKGPRWFGYFRSPKTINEKRQAPDLITTEEDLDLGYRPRSRRRSASLPSSYDDIPKGGHGRGWKTVRGVQWKPARGEKAVRTARRPTRRIGPDGTIWG